MDKHENEKSLVVLAAAHHLPILIGKVSDECCDFKGTLSRGGDLCLPAVFSLHEGTIDMPRHIKLPIHSVNSITGVSSELVFIDGRALP